MTSIEDHLHGKPVLCGADRDEGDDAIIGSPTRLQNLELQSAHLERLIGAVRRYRQGSRERRAVAHRHGRGRDQGAGRGRVIDAGGARIRGRERDSNRDRPSRRAVGRAEVDLIVRPEMPLVIRRPQERLAVRVDLDLPRHYTFFLFKLWPILR